MAYTIEVYFENRGWEWQGEAVDRGDAIAMAATTAKGNPWKVRWENTTEIVASSKLNEVRK
jgi:hypothetical protein